MVVAKAVTKTVFRIPRLPCERSVSEVSSILSDSSWLFLGRITMRGTSVSSCSISSAISIGDISSVSRALSGRAPEKSRESVFAKSFS
jgi:hypothetical protein